MPPPNCAGWACGIGGEECAEAPPLVVGLLGEEAPWVPWPCIFCIACSYSKGEHSSEGREGVAHLVESKVLEERCPGGVRVEDAEDAEHLLPRLRKQLLRVARVSHGLALRGIPVV
jgi:hypothetical protein